MIRTVAAPLFVLGTLVVGAGSCGLVNAWSEGEFGSPLLQSNCSIEDVCDCYGVGCQCDREILTCECSLDPESGELCEVYTSDGDVGCSGDTCVCGANDCGCNDSACICDPVDCGAPPTAEEPGPPDAVVGTASCAIDGVCSCLNGGPASCACGAGQCVCLPDGTNCTVRAEAGDSCIGSGCACVGDACLCSDGSCTCPAGECQTTPTICGDGECAIGGEPLCPFDCSP